MPGTHEDLAREIAQVYRTVLWPAMDPEALGERTISEVHLRAGEAVVGWLVLGGYIQPEAHREAVIAAWLESEEATSREHAEYLWEMMVSVSTPQP